MRFEKPATGSLAGIAASSVLAAVAQPIIGLAAGAVAALAVVSRQDVIRPYATVGTAWSLGLAGVLFLVPIYSQAYKQSTFFSLLIIGLLSAGVLGLRKGIKSLISKAVEKKVGDEETAEKSGRTAASIVGTLVLAWSVLNAKERLARSGIVGLLAPVTFVLDLIGFSVQIPWILENGINLTLFVFVGSVVVGFHTLSSWHATLLLKDDENVRAAGRKAKQGVSTAGTKSKQTAGQARDTLSAKLATAREEVRLSADDSADGAEAVATEERTNKTQGATAESGSTDRVAGEATGNGEMTTAADAAPRDESADGERQRCRSCDDVIDPAVRFCPSCGSQSPTDDCEPAERPSATGEQSSADAAPSPAVVEVARDIDQRIEPESATARILCRTLAAESDDADELRSAIEETVRKLERRDAVVDAVDSIDTHASVVTLERAEDTLDEQPTQLSAAVGALVDRVIQAETALDDQAADREELSADIEMICSAAVSVDGVSVRPSEPETGAERIASALEAGELTFRRPTTSVASVVHGSSVARPQSPVGKDLYAALSNPSDEATIESTLEESISILDAYAETREMLSDITDADIRTRIDSLSTELQQRDTTVYSQLGNRVRELEAMLDGQSDDIRRYAVYQELLFYDRTLVPRLSRQPAGRDGASDRLVRSIQRQIDEIEREYIAVRANHNHAIPRHFLQLAEELVTDAKRDTQRQPDRATGVLSGTERIVESVQGLYDRNEYSVMLRRLNGE